MFGRNRGRTPTACGYLKQPDKHEAINWVKDFETALSHSHLPNRDIVNGRKPSLKQDDDVAKGNTLTRRRFLTWCGSSCTAFFPRFLAGKPPRRLPEPTLDSLPRFTQAIHLTPHYRSRSSLDKILEKVDPAQDVFPTETAAFEINRIFLRWGESLTAASPDVGEIQKSLNSSFVGSLFQFTAGTVPRSDATLGIWRRHFSVHSTLNSTDFVSHLRHYFGSQKFLTAEFKIVDISLPSTSDASVRARIRYDLVDTGPVYHRQQRIGFWDTEWSRDASGDLKLTRWQPLEETCSRSFHPIFAEITEQVLGGNDSYHQQLAKGTDYWRTVLDGACGIDIYGNYGVAVGDTDNDGFDDLYICQPSGLPNRLYRNRGDGTFEDITERAGVGVIDSSPCALFADINNDGHQDLIVVRGTGPLLFLNLGDGRFHLKENAFHFEQAPQGTFTGAALADYDRDGWLDIYFCLYSYYQGPDRYRYPAPYYDAQNGPPNFLFRNNRDGTFQDVTRAAGLNQNNNRFSFACGWCDYNQDGWPDLYVANDFGQKNLYRNNGNGTFTDVAREAGVLDTGAGMSVCWLDYNNDGRQDLYVADMWTAAGLRVTALKSFMPDAPEEIRALYRKHAMGNSLFQNEGEGGFGDRTAAAGVGMGRWAWSSDAWDFDHDGYPDLYIANGMISGLKKQELSSFFWRQVVARSPIGQVPTHDYEQGWNAINELIRSDGTWNGYERNVFYANNRDGSFSDVSGAVGLDLIDDSRSFALTDLDHDGRPELILKNRTGPQVRVFRNVMPELGHAIAFRLCGHRSNRDAIGASITVDSEIGRQVKFLQAGSGFLAQHSKEMFFGLGRSTAPVHATVRWPNGQVQQFKNLPLDHRVEIEEGIEHFKATPFRSLPQAASRPQSAVKNEATAPVVGDTGEASWQIPASLETWLVKPLAPVDFSLPDLAGHVHSLGSYRDKPVLLSFWTLQILRCSEELRKLQNHVDAWRGRGVSLLSINVDDSKQWADVRALARRLNLTFPILLATSEVTALYNLLYRYIFDRRRNLSLPTSFLCDEEGMIVKLYQGPLNPAHLSSDLQHLPQTPHERQTLALPFPGAFYGGDFSRNYFTYGVAFAEHGYQDAAEAAFLRATREEPESADAYYDLGTLYIRQQKWDLARKQLLRAAELKPNDPLTLNNLGVIAARQGQVQEAASYFNQVLRSDPHNVLALENLADLLRTQGHYPEAQDLLERALAAEPQNPELNYKLGMVFANARKNDEARVYLKKAIQLRPDYAEALNNLGVLDLLVGKPEEATAEFAECIRQSPRFDQAYLNLARVYIQLDKPRQAESVLRDLLKEVPDHPLAQKYLQELSRRYSTK
jgi:Flp pilus assembly protein TadD/peroxiredoxin